MSGRETAPEPQDSAAHDNGASSDPVTQLHEACDEVIGDASAFFTRAGVEPVARKLGIWKHGHVCLHSDEHATYVNLFLEHCLLDVEKNGKTALQRFRSMRKLEPGSLQAQIVDALDNSAVTLFRVASRISDTKVWLKDLSTDEDVAVEEPRMWPQVEVGQLIVSRLLKVDDLCTTTGRVVVIDSSAEEDTPQIPQVKNRREANARTVALLRPLMMAAAEEAHSHDHDHGHEDHHHAH